MEERYFDSYVDFGDHMYELAKEGKSVTAVTTYEETAEIIKWLIPHEDVLVDSVEFHPYEWEHYDKEFYISITSDLIVYVEPVYVKSDSDEFDMPLYTESDIIFYSGDADYSLVKKNRSEESYEFIIGAEDEPEDKCGSCSYDCNDCPKRDSDNDFRIHTITISRKDVPLSLLDILF